MLISGVRCICANILGWIRYVASAIATELLKFALVLLMAYFLAYGIFELWAQIIPDIPSTQRLSAAAAALVSRAARVSGATQTEYPFVVEPPTRTTITRNSDATAPPATPPATPPKPVTRASTESANVPTMSRRRTGSNADASAPTATPTEVLAEAEAAVEAAAVAAAAAAVAVAEASEIVDEQQRNAGADKD